MKYLSIIRYAFLGISVLTVLLYFLGAVDVDLMLNWAYVLLALTVVVSLVFPVVNIIQNPQGALGTLVGLAIVAVVVGISYMFSSDATIITPVNTFDNPVSLKLSDTGLYATYITLGAAIVISIGCEIANIFK